MSNLFISNVVFDFGESKSIDNLSFCMSPDELNAFRVGGFEYYVKESRDVYEVCEKVAGKVLDESHIDRNEITDIVYVSSTKFVDKVVGLSADLSMLSANLGINKAIVHALSAGECGSLVHALRFCEQTMQERKDSMILLIFAEKIMTDEERYSPGTSIRSDGVAACLLRGGRTRNCYEVVARSEVTDHRATRALAKKEYSEALRFKLMSARVLSSNIFSKVDFDKSAIKHVISNNMMMHVCKMEVLEFGLDVSKLRLPTLSQKAHAFTMDGLLNLKGTRMADGDMALCVSFGSFFWGACIVKYHA